MVDTCASDGGSAAPGAELRPSRVTAAASALSSRKGRVTVATIQAANRVANATTAAIAVMAGQTSADRNPAARPGGSGGLSHTMYR